MAIHPKRPLDGSSADYEDAAHMKRPKLGTTAPSDVKSNSVQHTNSLVNHPHDWTPYGSQVANYAPQQVNYYHQPVYSYPYPIGYHHHHGHAPLDPVPQMFSNSALNEARWEQERFLPPLPQALSPDHTQGSKTTAVGHHPPSGNGTSVLASSERQLPPKNTFPYGLPMPWTAFPTGPAAARHSRAQTRPTTTACGKKSSEGVKDGGLVKKANDSSAKASPKKPKKKDEEQPVEEKRLKRFRPGPPQKYWEIHHRAVTQRMFVIDRKRKGTEDYPTESIKLAGTTGNVYTVVVSKVPRCDCPHAEKGNQCKHVIYVMAKVLRAPEHLQYQLALLSSELREIFANAPPILGEDNTSRDGNRKPIEGECAICCCDLEPSENIVWCKAACGNNIHNECFSKWAAARQGQSGGVTCPFCRTPWMGDEDMLKTIVSQTERNEEGYVNIAGELGLSGERDYSTYNRFWMRGRQRRGYDVGDWEDDWE